MTALGVTVADAERLGVRRSLEPRGALPHISRRLDATLPANAYEVELAAEMLAIDATRTLPTVRRRSGADPEAMAELITTIVADHGKHQNPVTGSGGVVLGRVTNVGTAPSWTTSPRASSSCRSPR